MVIRPKGTDSPVVAQATHAKPQGLRGLSAEIDSELALRAAQTNCTLLITGETGVGKGHMARWLHEHSPRAAGPYIPVNCGAIPDMLIDSQLFGHARGSFSGAVTEHLGLVRAAEHGTLLLDEISELPHSAQNRLLRLLQDREVQPVGHSRPIIVDVRVFAATNIDLAVAVADHRFREDLLYRLDVLRLHVRPLRERLEELPGLLRRFHAEFAELYRQDKLTFDDSAMSALCHYYWPGNVRQLRTLVERLHVLCPSERITAGHILEIGRLDPMPISFDGGPVGAAGGIAGAAGTALKQVRKIKEDQLRQILAKSDGSISSAAQAFGVHRSTIYRWLRGP